MSCTASGAEAAAREGSPEEYYTPDFYTDAAKYWEVCTHVGLHNVVYTVSVCVCVCVCVCVVGHPLYCGWDVGGLRAAVFN